MASNRKTLRAWVRYDGSGRIVPSSVILQKNPPKVGNWKPIPTYECCDPFDQDFLLLEESSPENQEFLLQEDDDRIIL